MSTTTDPAARLNAAAEELEQLDTDATDAPWFVSDCEGELSLWREGAVKLNRDEDGEVVGYQLPGSYVATDQIIEHDLDTWDPGEDVSDDQRRADVALIAVMRPLAKPMAEVLRKVAWAVALDPDIIGRVAYTEALALADAVLAANAEVSA